MKPGDRVKLRAQALWSMGLLAGELGLRVWTVEACSCDLCALGRHVRVDDRHCARAALRAADGLVIDELRAADCDVLTAGIGAGIRKGARR
jgi:hypothetical protein